jgi:branched-chain amino acid transport system ATP-binding protein
LAASSDPAVGAATQVAERASALLEVEGLSAGYGRRLVVHDVSLAVEPGEIVTILGHNGAGKTTILKAVFGLLRPDSGTVRMAGEDVTGQPCAARVKAGMSFVPAERPVFGPLSVLDNLRLGAFSEHSSAERQRRLDGVHELFPILAERAGQLAGTLSGGQQRALSIGMALMASPRLLLLDEPSLGLSPTLVRQTMEVLARLAQEQSVSILMLEQNVVHALQIANRAYVVRSGRVLLEEGAAEMRDRGQWWDLF